MNALDTLRLECDGMTRVVSALLLRDGIADAAMCGTLSVASVGEIPLHHWIELADGRLIDLRARMWLDGDPRVPHGVVLRDQADALYVGRAVELPYSPVVFWALTDLTIDAFAPAASFRSPLRKSNMAEAGTRPSEDELSALPQYVRDRWPVAVARAARKGRSVRPNQCEPIGEGCPEGRHCVAKGDLASARRARVDEAARGGGRLSPRVRLLLPHLRDDHGRGSRSDRPACGHHACKTFERHPLAVFDATGWCRSAVEAISSLTAPATWTFLKDGDFSVYEVRPMACRLLLNLDGDDLLSRSVSGQDVPVPYADASQLRTLFLMAQANTPMADIRDFFPGHT